MIIATKGDSKSQLGMKNETISHLAYASGCYQYTVCRGEGCGITVVKSKTPAALLGRAKRKREDEAP